MIHNTPRHGAARKDPSKMRQRVSTTCNVRLLEDACMRTGPGGAHSNQGTDACMLLAHPRRAACACPRIDRRSLRRRPFAGAPRIRQFDTRSLTRATGAELKRPTDKSVAALSHNVAHHMGIVSPKTPAAGADTGTVRAVIMSRLYLSPDHA